MSVNVNTTATGSSAAYRPAAAPSTPSASGTITAAITTYTTVTGVSPRAAAAIPRDSSGTVAAAIPGVRPACGSSATAAAFNNRRAYKITVIRSTTNNDGI